LKHTEQLASASSVLAAAEEAPVEAEEGKVVVASMGRVGKQELVGFDNTTTAATIKMTDDRRQ
jgi:hypothetical protein